MKVLKLEMKNADVVKLQTMLNQLSYGVPATGEFDAATEGAVKKYQESIKSTVDGIVGRGTWVALHKATNTVLLADFDAFLPTLLKHEGGLVDHPNDPGGLTNKGITLKTFEAYAQKALGIQGTADNLKKLTNEQAGKIYKMYYWDPIKGDRYECQELANIIFDFYVNAGGNATKLLQKVLNDMGAKLTVDGAIGEGTFKAMASFNVVDVYQNYKEARKKYYEEISTKNPKLQVFLKGWLNRVNEFPDLKK